MHRILVLPLMLALFLPSCATNPVTGKSEFNIVSEQEELEMGREAHEEILSEYAVYDEKPELNELVDRMGRRIAAHSPRPQLPWTFTILDTPMVNAMALPGGYIYVTRGILERMNSEDELAGVIGHEVAHVAARHSAKAISNATLAQVGLVTAAVLAGEENTERYGALVMIGAGLLFTKYSRSQETQADLLGTEYMSGVGYNPRGSENMLLGLQRLEGGRISGIERYFMDHPDPKKRVDDVRREITTLQTADASVTDRPLERDAFVKMLDGIVTGNSTMATTVRDGMVYNRTYGLTVPTPRGWEASVESEGLFAFQPKSEDQVIYAQELKPKDLEASANARAAVRAQLEEAGLVHDDSTTIECASGERFTIDSWRGTGENASLSVASTQYRLNNRAVAFLHIAEAGKGQDALARVIESLEFGNVDHVKPPRLRVRMARRGETWDSLTGNAEEAGDLAHMNGVDYPSQIPPGMLIKVR